MSAFDDLRKAAKQSGTPATVALIGLLVGTFFINWFLNGRLSGALDFVPANALSRPWTFLTYSLAAEPSLFIFFLFTCMWLWWIGGSVERDLGTNRFVTFWIGLTLTGALAILAAAGLMGFNYPVHLLGCFIPLAGITVAWGTRNPGSIVNLYMVIPVAAKWIAWIMAVSVLIEFGQGNPMMGVFACVPLALAWAFADNRLPGLTYGRETRSRAAWKPSEKDDRYFDEVRKRERDREDRERLRRLFEGSLKDDPKDDRDSGAGH